MLSSKVVWGVSSILKNAGRCNALQTLGPKVSLSIAGQRFSSFFIQQSQWVPALSNSLPSVVQHQPSRGYAARKGTRAKRAAKAKKGKKEVEVKKGWVPANIRKLEMMPYQKQRPFDDSHYPPPIDDVYFMKKHPVKKYPFEEALQNLRDVHHPTQKNVPNAPLHLRVNLDMKYPNRPNKFMDGWRSVIEMKSPFLLEGMVEPSLLAFCIEDVDYIDNVLKEGRVEMAGGKEIIKAIQAGEVNTDEFEYLIAHPAVVPELAAIRGLIKRKFPSLKSGTINVDLVSEAKRLKSGIKIQCVKNDREPDFGYIETAIGTLDMEGLYDNFMSILADAVPRRVANKDPSEFVISCILKTPGNGFEDFKIDLTDVLDEVATRKKSTEAD